MLPVRATSPQAYDPISVLMPAGRSRRMSFGGSLEIVQADSQFPMRMVETVDRSLSPKLLSPFSAPSQALKLCPPTKTLGRDPDESEAIICLTGHLQSQTTFKIRRISGFFYCQSESGKGNNPIFNRIFVSKSGSTA